MGNKKKLAILFFVLSVLLSTAQNGTTGNTSNLADRFFEDGKVYVVVVVVAMVVVGILLYLFMLDRKLNRIEKEMKK